jgi:DNA-binding SARP family transcriptional activator/TolB-like protein
MSRDKLIAYLWPETDTDSGRHLLKQACHDLRRELGQPDLFQGRKFLQLNPAVITSDVRRFEAALAQGDLAGAVAFYAGPFLDGFYLDRNESEEFGRWVEVERERLARRVGVALQRQAAEASAHGDHATAAEWWRRLAALDPLSAEATHGLMRSLAARRERAEALRVGREYIALVRRELDAAPARAIATLMDQLRLQSDEPPVQPALAAAPPPPAPPIRSAPPDVADTRSQPRPMWSRRSVLFASGVLAALVILVTVFATDRDARVVVAVSPIRAYLGADSGLGHAITEMLATNLARTPDLQVISTTRVAETGDARATISRAARRAGATDLVEGALFRRPDGTLRLQLQVVDLRSGLVRRAYVAQGPDAIALADSLGGQLALGLAAPRH